MELLQLPGDRPEPTPALARRFERQVLAPARRIGEDLPLVAVTPPPPPTWIMQPSEDRTWVLAKYDADPVAMGRGGLFAPEAVIERQTSLYRAGVDFDYVLVGHELPGRWQPGDPLPDVYLPDEAARLDQIIAAQEALLGTGWKLLQAALGAGLAAGKAAWGTASDLAAVIATDPFLLGGIEQGGLVAWTRLGEWDERS